MAKCGGCGEDLNEKCKEDPSVEVVRIPNTLHYSCDRGHSHMPHYAVCVHSGGKTTTGNPMGPGIPIPVHYLTAPLVGDQ